MTLLANLNARSSHQLKPDPTTGVDEPHIPTMVFTPGQNPVTSGTDMTSSSRVLSIIRSATRTIHHALTASRIDEREAQVEHDGPGSQDE